MRAFAIPDHEAPVDWFTRIGAEVEFECSASAGREGAIVVAMPATGAVPLVRSMTAYDSPAQVMGPALQHLTAIVAPMLGAAASAFNNVMVERYQSPYRTMGPHTDQALDLADASWICIFTCYNKPDTEDVRTLVCTDKATGDRADIPLRHNSCVAFSVEENRRMRHQIVARGKPDPHTTWLGVTMRTSKRALVFADGRPYLHEGVPLVLADESQRRAAFALRRRENLEREFEYAHNAVHFTVSPSDLMAPRSITGDS
jgi:hypothetical protein